MVPVEASLERRVEVVLEIVVGDIGVEGEAVLALSVVGLREREEREKKREKEREGERERQRKRKRECMCVRE